MTCLKAISILLDISETLKPKPKSARLCMLDHYVRVAVLSPLANSLCVFLAVCCKVLAQQSWWRLYSIELLQMQCAWWYHHLQLVKNTPERLVLVAGRCLQSLLSAPCKRRQMLMFPLVSFFAGTRHFLPLHPQNLTDSGKWGIYQYLHILSFPIIPLAFF